jgi:hypothetical protein
MILLYGVAAYALAFFACGLFFGRREENERAYLVLAVCGALLPIVSLPAIALGAKLVRK